MRTEQSVKKLALAAAVAACSLNAHAGATVSFGEDKSISVGFGLRFSGSKVEDAAPSGKNYSSDFNLDSARIFLGGSLNKYIGGFLNTEKGGDGKISILDAVVKFTVSPELNIWAGRVLSPSDRANMAGAYYSLGGGYWQLVASRYGANGGIIAGRDDGVVVWGQVADGKLGYSIGAFEGHTFGIGSLTQSQASGIVDAKDSLMYAGRLQYDFWDAEPGYYGTGNYLGSKDILAIGLAGRYQKDGVLTALGAKGDYTSYNIDFLLEKKIAGAGAISFEAAFYDYDTDNLIASEEGEAYSVAAGYIFQQTVGWGRFQPFVRWQRFNDDANIKPKQYDVGVLYVIDGYNAQLSGTYRKTKNKVGLNTDAFIASLQVQF